MDEDLFTLETNWTVSPYIVTEVAGCKNCNEVGGISIIVKNADETGKMELTVICKLCGMENYMEATNPDEARLMLFENIDLWDEEE